MPIAEVIPEYCRSFESVVGEERSELCTLSDYNHKVDGPRHGNYLATCVANVWRVIKFANHIYHGLRYLIQPDEAESDSSITDDH